jgi:hypothetical protein
LLDCGPDGFNQVTVNFTKWMDDYVNRHIKKQRALLASSQRSCEKFAVSAAIPARKPTFRQDFLLSGDSTIVELGAGLESLCTFSPTAWILLF